MTRLRLGVLLALAVALGAFHHAPQAMAAAEVHRLNLVLSAMPSQLDGAGINDLIERYNEYPLGAKGFEGVDKIGMGWIFDSELRYFVRPNFALAAGVGYLKVQSQQDYLPTIGTSINVRAQVITVPVHVGGQYYLAPYNQGDFQARAYVGGGLLSLASTTALFATTENGMTTRGDTLDVNSLGGTNQIHAEGEAPGYYAEVGAHMFFAARYSVIVGVMYRSMRVREMLSEGEIIVPDPNRPVSVPPLATTLLDKDGNPATISELDLSGFSVRMALAIGF